MQPRQFPNSRVTAKPRLYLRRLLVAVRSAYRRSGRPLSIDVLHDRRGPLFHISVDREQADLDVIDVRPEKRHLLLLARMGLKGSKEKFLCGHDERAWFVAAVPNDRGVSNVRTALEALKPPLVRDAQDRAHVRFRDRAKRNVSP